MRLSRKNIGTGVIALPFLFAACVQSPEADFFERLSALCGNAYEGGLVSDDAIDADMQDQRMVMHVRECTSSEIRIPFHVGDDHSRTWVITRNGTGLTLRHEHRHQDGSFDPVTGYGGPADARTSGSRANFPADAATKAVFGANDISVSNANIWAMEVRPVQGLFAYEMQRPNRFFRVEFDTSETVPLPPAPWGAE